jgi:hypothetical protein
MRSGQRMMAILAGAAVLAMPVTAAAAGLNRTAVNNSRPSGGFHVNAPRSFAAPRTFSAPRTFNAPRASSFAPSPRSLNFSPARAPIARASAGLFRPAAPVTPRPFNRVTSAARAPARFTAPVAPTVWNRPEAAAAPLARNYTNYNNGTVCDADGDNCQPAYGYGYNSPALVPIGHHREPDDDDFNYNGGYGAAVPSVRCDADGDDCVPTGYYQGTYYDPAYYFNQAPGESLQAHLQRLIYARNMAWIKYQNAMARGDRVGAKHLYNAYVSLNNRIAHVDARLGRRGLAAAAVPPLAAAPAPVAAAPLTSLLGGTPGYPNYGYNPALGYNPAYANYGYNGYSYNNGGLTTMLGPLLQQFIP